MRGTYRGSIHRGVGGSSGGTHDSFFNCYLGSGPLDGKPTHNPAEERKNSQAHGCEELLHHSEATTIVDNFCLLLSPYSAFAVCLQLSSCRSWQTRCSARRVSYILLIAACAKMLDSFQFNLGDPPP